MSHKFSIIITALALLFVAACSPAAQTAVPKSAATTQSSTAAQPAAAAPQATTVAVQPTAPAAQPEPSDTPGLSNRVSDSIKKLLMFDHKVLDSYRIDMSGVEPNVDIVDNTLNERKFERQIEMAGDNVHLISKLTEKNETTTREGYIIGGSNKDTLKDYEVKNGKAEDAGGMVNVGFAMFPLSVGAPVYMGAQGATLQGEEQIAGRTAEKYAIDSANIPQAALDVTGFKSIKGTAWIDKETGTLLKLVLDYAQEYADPDPKNTKPLGVGNGHIDLAVSQIGQAQVNLPK
ncbi:MAG TPA: hypothetical protein VMP08_20305 [Anaerolineae bacterium]|nr:hypothetical protein [Anaerolineae bacterium]